jgi:hypothetical protein
MRGCPIKKSRVRRIGKRLPVEIKDGKIIHGFRLVTVFGGSFDMKYVGPGTCHAL